MTDLPAGPGRYDAATEFAFQPDELLVAVSHQVAVVDALDQLGVVATVVDSSEALGLSRLTLASRSDSGSAPLDSVLDDLYSHFATRCEGWVPAIGKNRIVGRVVGSGELSFGGAGDPRPTAAPAEWPRGRMGPGRGARVAVIDTAVAEASPLAAGWLDRYSDTFSPDPAVSLVPASGHATFVAGLILSQAPAATVEVRQVLDSTGHATAWQVATAIVDAGLNGADVINLSLVCYTADGAAPLAMAQAIDRLDPQIVVVAAAGNHGAAADAGVGRRPAWPAALPSVLAVGAADDDGVIASFTPHDVPWIDVLTNGVDLVSSYLRGDVTIVDAEKGTRSESFDGFASWSGSSFASALVTGAIAAGIAPGRVSALTALAAFKRQVHAPQPGQAPFIRLRTGPRATAGG